MCCAIEHVGCAAGPAPFASTVGNPRSDAAFLEVLKSAAGSSGSGGASGKNKQGAKPSAAQLRGLALAESDVAKVTREGVSHVAFHPATAHLVVATGDKQGHVALWDVDKKTTHEVRFALLPQHSWLIRNRAAACQVACRRFKPCRVQLFPKFYADIRSC